MKLPNIHECPNYVVLNFCIELYLDGICIFLVNLPAKIITCCLKIKINICTNLYRVCKVNKSSLKNCNHTQNFHAGQAFACML